MQTVALSWLVYRLTNSAVLLGVVGFLNQFPIFISAPFAGVLADRKNRRSILFVTQSLAMIQAIILGVLVLAKLITTWHILLLSTLLGIVNAFDIPARQSFIVEIVEKKKI